MIAHDWEKSSSFADLPGWVEDANEVCVCVCAIRKDECVIAAGVAVKDSHVFGEDDDAQ